MATNAISAEKYNLHLLFKYSPQVIVNTSRTYSNDPKLQQGLRKCFLNKLANTISKYTFLISILIEHLIGVFIYLCNHYRPAFQVII